jgi:hypothetical protein
VVQSVLAVLELVAHSDSDHLDRTDRSILGVGWKTFDFFDDIHSRRDAPEHRVLRRTRGKPVQVVVVNGVDEELTAAAVGSSRIRHGERARLIGNFGIIRVLVGNCSVRAVSGPCLRAFWIPTVGTAKLKHEPIDDAMKMQAIVEATACQGKKVLRRHGHFVRIEFNDDFTF